MQKENLFICRGEIKWNKSLNRRTINVNLLEREEFLEIGGFDENSIFR